MLRPELRLGQLIANLATLPAGRSWGHLGSGEDEELWDARNGNWRSWPAGGRGRLECVQGGSRFTPERGRTGPRPPPWDERYNRKMPSILSIPQT